MKILGANFFSKVLTSDLSTPRACVDAPPACEMQILVKTVSGKTVTLDVSDADTTAITAIVKAELEEKIRVRAAVQRARLGR